MEASLVSLTPRELQRLTVLERIRAGDLSQLQGARILGLSVRQLKRLVRAFRQAGAASLASKRRGRPSNRATDPLRLQCALEIVQQHYPDFGPTLASEKLAERHGIALNSETLRRAMIRTGIWKSHARKERKAHLPRPRRDCFGELVQLDGSYHAWFEGRGPKCTLLVAIDDATSTLLSLRMEPTETSAGYFALLHDYLPRHGRPLSVYTDRAAIFRATVEAASGEKTQFARALDELDIELICAHSPQAKGRVERVNGTLQDRLVKELRLHGICSIQAANVFLPTYIAAHNKRFTCLPKSDFDVHRTLEAHHDLERILCTRSSRKISSHGIVSYENRYFAIDLAQFRRLSSRIVNVRATSGGRIIIEQGEYALRYAEIENPSPTRRAQVTDRADLPQPNKAHIPSSTHPWRTYSSPRPHPRGHL
jgi:transposase